jgi:membrane-bound lytic murein transglycosylase D
MPNLPVTLEQRTLDYVKFFRDSEQGRAIAENWARNSGRYVPAIDAELARANMPTDLVWLSLVESGHNPTIRSPKGAAGLWQFVPESARMYGLTVDRWVDERLDPVRSTQAALSFLSDLERRFGNWELAMAAYNMGHQGLIRSISMYNTIDFWRLSGLEAALPWETALYVPKVLATAIVMKNKSAFGLADIPPDPEVSFDTVYVPAGVTLASVAQSAGVPESTLASLNPHLLAARTPPAGRGEAPRLWPVHVPYGQGKNVSAAFERPVPERHATVRVRLGDTPESIAERLRGSEDELRELNRISAGERLQAGATLLVPPSWSEALALPPREDSEDMVAVLPARFQYDERERVFYHTQPGDDLQTIGRAFGVRPSDIAIWNALDARANLQSDMVLQVYVHKGAALTAVRHARERNAGKRLEIGSLAFFAHFEAEQGRQRLQIRAREGDTLQTIGRRYGLSAGTMERINHFWRGSRLAEGTPVVVYAKDGPLETETLLSRAPDPLPPLDPPDPSALPGAPLE